MADALHRAYVISLFSEAEAQLVQAEYDSSSSSSSSSSSDTSSDSSMFTSSPDGEPSMPPMSDIYLDMLGNLYSQHYLSTRDRIEKDQAALHLLLHDWKHTRPEIFRSYLRVEPACFDALIETIREDPVFHNESNNEQMPVEEQVAIALYRFAHYGNAASQMKVALWAGVGYGTVDLVTRRVMTACCSDAFRNSAVRWGDHAAVEAAKQWVEEQSCPSWRDGWLMVDGTLVPLFQRPGLFGNVWFDRKSNYSLNVQVSGRTLLSYVILSE